MHFAAIIAHPSHLRVIFASLITGFSSIFSFSVFLSIPLPFFFYRFSNFYLPSAVYACVILYAFMCLCVY